MASSQPTHWADVQQKTFTRWINLYLKERGMHCEDMEKDLCNGVLLVNLIEIISGESLGRHNKHPRVPAQKLENVQICLEFITGPAGLKLVNIGPEDVVDGRLKLILGLIWTLILRYQINMKEGDGSGAESELLRWVNEKVNPKGYQVNNFQKDWNDGKVINALVDALRPGLSPNHADMDPSKGADNCKQGIDTARDKMGVADLIHHDEMANPRVDKQAMMTYISQFRNLQEHVVDDAELCEAYGPGLTEGIVNNECGFTVQTPGRGKLEVKVEGPSTSAQPVVKDVGDGRYEVSYTPTEAGQWKVHVTLDGKHIPGSIFTVTVLEDESLGGEGKFRVFFSTTSSTNKAKTDVFSLQRLLEAKKIHERDDFEPWIPVDILEREDRETVFRKAHTRQLPIVVVDDVVVGDFDALDDLNERGILDRILTHGIAGAGREFLKDKKVYETGAAAVGGAGGPPKTTATMTPAAAAAPAAAPAPAAAAGGAAFCSSCGRKRDSAAAKFCAGCGKPF